MCGYVKQLLWFKTYLHFKNKNKRSFSVCFFNPHPRLCFYWFLEGGREREKNINMTEKHRQVASCILLDRELNPQPKYVPWSGIKPENFCAQDNTPINWTTWPGQKKFFDSRALFFRFVCLEYFIKKINMIHHKILSKKCPVIYL